MVQIWLIFGQNKRLEKCFFFRIASISIIHLFHPIFPSSLSRSSVPTFPHSLVPHPHHCHASERLLGLCFYWNEEVKKRERLIAPVFYSHSCGWTNKQQFKQEIKPCPFHSGGRAGGLLFVVLSQHLLLAPRHQPHLLLVPHLKSLAPWFWYCKPYNVWLTY